MSISKSSAIDGISYIPSDSLASAIRKLTFKENRAFGVTDVRGEIPRGGNSELGIYYNDTRHLNTWETLINGQAPVPLAQELRHQGSTWVLSMTNRDLPMLGGGGRIPRDTLLIRRILSLHEDTLFEILTIRNFSNQSQILQLEHWAGARFEDIFEIRGMTRIARGKLLSPTESSSKHWSLSYQGLDGRTRSTHLHRLYEAEKIRLAPYLTGHFCRIGLKPKEIITLRTIASFDRPSSLKFHGEPFETLDAGTMMRLATEKSQKPPLFSFRMQSDNAIINRALECSATDITTLLTTEGDQLLYPYAGIPWFSAPFGRDGIITAYQLLPWAPQVARGVLEFVFKGLGEKWELFTDEEPGKAFHELRRGEMALLREVPFTPYFGTVDATPLALTLLHEYACWTGDRDFVIKWWPAAVRALNWMDHQCDSSGSPFLQYSRKSEKGLSNQGWKDSHDSIMHEDGRLADPPIHLCEVQAYGYRARQGIAELADWIGQPALAREQRIKALRLKTIFQERFWDPTEEFIFLALDGQGNPCKVRSSNMGHCLWGGILTDAQARSVSRTLMTGAMFSGHGIRTLADTEAGYNPLSYHNGSIWPHDNSIIAEGLRRYDRRNELERLAEGLIQVIEASDDFRLPELFCGFRKRGLEPPVPYEVACKPQAWAAGTPFLLLRSLLGMSMNLNQSEILFRDPILTSRMNWLEIEGLRIQDTQLNLRFSKSAGSTQVKSERTNEGRVRALRVRSNQR